MYESSVHLYLVRGFVSCLRTNIRELGKVQRRTIWMLDGVVNGPHLWNSPVDQARKRAISAGLLYHKNIDSSHKKLLCIGTLHCVILRMLRVDVDTRDLFHEEKAMKNVNTKISAIEIESVGN